MTEKRENKTDSTRKKKPVAGRIEILLIALCAAGCIMTGIAAGRRISHNKKQQDFHTRFEQLHERIENRKQSPVAFVQSAEWPENGYTEDYIREYAASQVLGVQPSDVWLKKEFDAGVYVWAGNFHDGKTGYAFEIDALTGEFLKWETEQGEGGEIE